MKLHSPQATHTYHTHSCQHVVKGLAICILFCKYFLSHTKLKVQNKSIKISKIIIFI